MGGSTATDPLQTSAGGGGSGTSSAAADVTAPVVTLSAPTRIEATSSAGAPVPITGSAIDDVDGPLFWSLTEGDKPVTSGVFSLGAHTVTGSAIDGAGNIGTATVSFEVVDTTAPKLTPISPYQVIMPTEMGRYAQANLDLASVYDAVDGVNTDAVTFREGDKIVDRNSYFEIGAHTITASAVDAAGNVGYATISLIVELPPPQFTQVQPNVTVEATAPNGAFFRPALSAVDAFGPVPITTDGPSDGFYAIDTSRLVTATASNATGSDQTQFIVKVVDTTGPMIASPYGLTVEATSAQGAVATFNPTAIDQVDGAVAVTTDIASGSLFITVEATSAQGARVSFKPTASDIVDGADAVSTDKASGSVFALGSTTVTATSTDAHHNTSNAAFKVNVVDTTGPTITVPADITVEATSAQGAAASFSPTASDIVDGADAVTTDRASGSVFALGVTTVTAMSSDAHHNTASATFKVSVVDTTAPVVTASAPTTEATSPQGANVLFTASALDLVDGQSDLVSFAENGKAVASGALFGLGHHVVTASAQDAAGNIGRTTFGFDVVDTTKPTISSATATYWTANALHPVGQSASGLTNDPFVSFQLAATDAGSGVKSVELYDRPGGDPSAPVIKLGSAALVSGVWTYNASLMDGAHAIEARVTDSVGNTTTQSFAPLTVDTHAPSVHATNVVASASGGWVLTGTGEAGLPVSVYDAGALVGTASTGADGRWSWAVAAPGSQVHSYTEQQTDGAGNLGLSGVTLFAAPANKALAGGSGDDLLIGRPNDTLTGNLGHDTFLFNPGFGKEVITDFTPGSYDSAGRLLSPGDMIGFGHGIFADLADVLSHAHQVGSDTVISLNGGNTITLQHVALSTLHASDFLIL